MDAVVPAVAQGDGHGRRCWGPSYPYRKFPIRQAIDEAKAAGCVALEVFGGHVPPQTPAAETAAILDYCHAQGVRVCGYGVVGLSPAATEPNLRFAHRLGCDYVSIDMNPRDREVAAALAAEPVLKLGIHNHGPGHHYSTIDSVAAVLAGQPASRAPTWRRRRPRARGWPKRPGLRPMPRASRTWPDAGDRARPTT